MESLVQEQGLDSLTKGIKPVSNNPNQFQNDPHGSEQVSDTQQHKKIKKRPKKKTKRHSPEYYEELKQAKFNHIREAHWDSRFVNDSIPDFISQKKMKTANKKNKSRSPFPNNITKPIKPINVTILPTLTHSIKNKTSIQRNYTQVSRSFQIRNKIKKQESSRVTAGQNFYLDQKTIKNQNNTSIIYIKEIQKIYQQHKFPICHKQFLIEISSKCQDYKIKNYLENQFKKLRQDKSSINFASKAIEKRQKQIIKIKQSIQKNNKQIPNELIQSYRTSTLFCIQQILKWRQQCQSQYAQRLSSHKKLRYIYQNTNYLINITKDLLFLKQYPFWKCQTSDPFLLSLTLIDNKNDLLKIRACQLLLLEQELNNIK